MTFKEAYQLQTPKDICRICHAKSITHKKSRLIQPFIFITYLKSQIFDTLQLHKKPLDGEKKKPTINLFKIFRYSWDHRLLRGRD